jgi:glycopeptide antibiotics resistance protein
LMVQQRTSGLASLANVALTMSVAAIAVVTLLPIDGDREVQLWPFGEIRQALSGDDNRLLLESVANILLFVPLGVAVRLRGLGIGVGVLIGFLASAAVEAAQWAVVSGRTVSVDDVLLNTVGVAVGHLALSRWKPIVDELADELEAGRR